MNTADSNTPDSGIPNSGDSGTSDGSPSGANVDASVPADSSTSNPDTPDAGAPAGTPDMGAPDAGAPVMGTPDMDVPDMDAPDAGVHSPDVAGPDVGSSIPADAQPSAPTPAESGFGSGGYSSDGGSFGGGGFSSDGGSFGGGGFSSDDPSAPPAEPAAPMSASFGGGSLADIPVAGSSMHEEDEVELEEAKPEIPAIDLLEGEITRESIDAFKDKVFSSVRQGERLRDWLESPMAFGVQAGLACWALGKHADAIADLESEKENPIYATCLAKSYTAVGRYADAESVLPNRSSNPEQAAAWLNSVERSRDEDKLRDSFSSVEAVLAPADVRYYSGRIKEFEGDAEAAIACYDEALAQDETHREALFRLAINVDLRGEDEEARELYEKALMMPPVNFACVMNLGILYEDMGNYRRAMQCFDLALQASPDDRRARMYRRDAAAALNMYYDEDQERREDKRNKILRTPINDFELSVRSRNCLAKMGVRTLGDLVKKTEAELLSYKNFGETSLNEIKEILKSKNMRLGMAQEELLNPQLAAAGGSSSAAEEPVAVEEAPDPNNPDPLRRPISELDLSVRSRRIVDLLKLRSIGDLAIKTEAELLACPNFGQTSLNEIKTKLDELGLGLRT